MERPARVSRGRCVKALPRQKACHLWMLLPSFNFHELKPGAGWLAGPGLTSCVKRIESRWREPARVAAGNNAIDLIVEVGGSS